MADVPAGRGGRVALAGQRRRRRNHRGAGDAAAPVGAAKAPHRAAQRFVQRLVVSVAQASATSTIGAGAACELSGGQGAGSKLPRGHAAAECLQPPGAGAARSALGERYLRGIREVERDFGGGGVALAVVDLQAVQDDLLEPIGHGGAHGARRRRIAVQPPAQLRQRARPRRTAACPSRARRAARPAQRGRCADRSGSPRICSGDMYIPVADRGAELLGEQIGKMAVVRRGRNRSASLRRSARYSTLAGLRSRWITSCRWISCSASASCAPMRGHLRRPRSGALAHPLVRRRAFDVLHDEVRRGLDVAVGDQRRVVRSLRERAEHHAALLEADDVDRRFPGAEARDLHDEGQRSAGPEQAVDRRHGADVQPLAEAKAVDLGARLRSAHLDTRARGDARGARASPPRGSSPRRANGRRRRGRRSGARARGRRAPSRRRCCGRAAGPAEPTIASHWRCRAVGIGVPGDRPERHRPRVFAHVVEPLLVHVAAEDELRVGRLACFAPPGARR